MPRYHPATGRKRINNLYTSLKRTLALQKKNRRWARVIINPAAGQFSPSLKIFNKIFRSAGIYWEVEVTQKFGDGQRLAEKAIAQGVDIIAACGGDGTVMDVAAGLIGKNVPLAILPAGTGNALAKELNIPLSLENACKLMVDPEAAIRRIDVAKASFPSTTLEPAKSRLFLLRLGIGLEAIIVQSADRQAKDRLGLFAYVMATFQALNQSQISHYQLIMDGHLVEADALACMVANAGTLGIPGLVLSPQIKVDDGLLDVLLIRRGDFLEVASFAASIMNPALANDFPHFQCRNLSITAAPPQGIEADGEIISQTPIQVSILHQVLPVIVPRSSQPIVRKSPLSYI